MKEFFLKILNFWKIKSLVGLKKFKIKLLKKMNNTKKS